MSAHTSKHHNQVRSIFFIILTMWLLLVLVKFKSVDDNMFGANVIHHFSTEKNVDV